MKHSTNECKDPRVEFFIEVMAQLNDNQCRLVEEWMENGDMGFQWDMAIRSFICLDRNCYTSNFPEDSFVHRNANTEKQSFCWRCKMFDFK